MMKSLLLLLVLSLFIILVKSSNEMLCLMDAVCKNKYKGVERKSPCYSPHHPTNNITDDDFYELLINNCPHLFDNDGELKHPICCSPEQEESMSRLIHQVDFIKRGCPSCAVNTKKYFCNLFCHPKQREIIKIEKKLKSNAIINITYFISEGFANKLFYSCHDVQLFGTNLLDQHYICGQYKRIGCDTNKFLTVIGSIDQMPMIVQPKILDSQSIVTINQQNYHPMDDIAYHCYESPPNENKCSCDHCNDTCDIITNNQIKRQQDINNNKSNTNHQHFNTLTLFFVTILITIILG